MRTDLKHSLNEGMNNLMTWRNRYTPQEYPEKVVLNIFYRKYTMEFLFPEILESFRRNSLVARSSKNKDFNEAFQELKMEYSATSQMKTHPVLLNLLTDHERTVGSTNYGIFAPLIGGARNGDSSKLEEIEYAYLYYLLADECVLLWGALGRTGLNKIEAVGKLSGMIIETDEIYQYGQIEEVLGKLCAAPYLKENYKTLPPLD